MQVLHSVHYFAMNNSKGQILKGSEVGVKYRITGFLELLK
jgi:hypothetical protein